MKKWISRILAAALVVTMCISPAAARDTDFFHNFPQDVPTSALVRTAPDDTGFQAAADALESAIQAGTATDEEITPLITAFKQEYNRLTTAFWACYLDYNRDPTSCADDYQKWSDLYNADLSRTVAVGQTGLNSGYADAFRKVLGDHEVERIYNQSADTEEQLKLLSQCDALVNQYWTGINAAYTGSVDGKSYTLSELDAAHSSGALTEDQYQTAFLEIAKQENAAVTPILASLVNLRNQYAVSKGYKNFAEYAYPNVYGRDFTTDDAEKFESYVRESFSSVFKECSEIQSCNADLYGDRLTSLNGLSQQQQLDLVGPYMTNVSSEYADLFSYMEKNKLCDIGASDSKLTKGFTIDLPEYHSAYIFNRPYGNFYDVKTLIHEFGHYAQSCLDDGAASCYDTAEIDSQGLESLYLKYADNIAGEAGGDAYRATEVNDLMASVEQGCIFDEFQQKLYEDGSMTPDEMNKLFCQLRADYGYVDADENGRSYSWVEVSHTFESPMYYLSYATSAATALELLTLSQDNYNAAADKYLQLVADSGDYSYRALIQKEGLTDVFVEGGVQKIANDTLRYMEKEAADVPDYTDISGNWFESGANLISACSLMHGDGTSFDPNGNASRAMFVTVLYRICGEGEKDEDAGFSDVTDASSWYYDAVNWAAQNGYVMGYDGKFSPDANITRQDMAVIMARMFAGEAQPSADETVLSRYSDNTSIADYARGSVTWITQDGMMQGYNGQFNPQGNTTRAEMGQVCLRLLG